MGASEERDVEDVAARFEREADDLQRHSDEVGDKIETTRQEWERKRGDPSVPGAVPEDRPEDAQADESPAPQAPPEDTGPGAAETPKETAVGPPADTADEDDAGE